MIRFLIQSVLLGVGLAMDAFSVSIVNGLREPHMRRRKQVLIAGTFAFFQFFMPVIGWFCVRSITAEFRAFQHLVPWIALLLLLYIGGKMLLEGVRAARLTPEERREALEEEAAVPRLGKHTLLLQGIATSIDALSVGFTIAEYSFPASSISSQRSTRSLQPCRPAEARSRTPTDPSPTSRQRSHSLIAKSQG